MTPTKPRALTVQVMFGDPHVFIELRQHAKVRPSSPLVTRQSAWKLRRHPRLYAKHGYKLVRADADDVLWIARQPEPFNTPLIDRPGPRLVQ
jgi:hypothetical protein